jgi:hypothetical protein
VPKYLEELDKFPVLQNNGFSFLIDASGKLFKAARPSLNDVETNIQAGRFFASVDVVSCVLMSLNFIFLAIGGSGGGDARYPWPWKVLGTLAQNCHHPVL